MQMKLENYLEVIMTPELIKKWLVRLVGSEGGYSNRNPKDDPGGGTKWGISKRSYPDLDIKNLTVEQAGAIYLHDFIMYFVKANIHESVIFQLLDFAVNSGIAGAVKVIQREFGLKDDGVIGPKTAGALPLS